MTGSIFILSNVSAGIDMSKWENKILELLKERETVTVPVLQKELDLSYDSAREMMTKLQNDELVSYSGGIFFTVNQEKVASEINDEDILDYLERRRNELLKRLEEIESDESDDEESDDDEADDEETDEETDDEEYDDFEDETDGAKDETDDESDDDEPFDEDEALKRLYYEDVGEEDDSAEIEDETDDLEKNMRGFLTRSRKPYEIDPDFYTAARQAYEEKSNEKLRAIPDSDLRALEEQLGSCFRLDEGMTAGSRGIQAFFTSELTLPDEVGYAPSVTSNERGEFYLHHPLIDPFDEIELCIREEFMMLLKRHGMFFGDGALIKQFLHISDAMSAAMELYGALCEAKMIIDKFDFCARAE